MRKYTLVNIATKKSYELTAQNKDDARKKANSGILPEGKYRGYDSKGYNLMTIEVGAKAKAKYEGKRPLLPKEQYDQLYYYTPGWILEELPKSKYPPQHYSSPRRYDTIDEVRKAALSKSKKIMQEINFRASNGWRTDGMNMSLCIFKGNKYLGFVTWGGIPGFPWKGTFSPAENPKDEVPLNADGTIYRGKGVVRVSTRRKM